MPDPLPGLPDRNGYALSGLPDAAPRAVSVGGAKSLPDRAALGLPGLPDGPSCYVSDGPPGDVSYGACTLPVGQSASLRPNANTNRMSGFTGASLPGWRCTAGGSVTGSALHSERAGDMSSAQRDSCVRAQRGAPLRDTSPGLPPKRAGRLSDVAALLPQCVASLHFGASPLPDTGMSRSIGSLPLGGLPVVGLRPGGGPRILAGAAL